MWAEWSVLMQADTRVERRAGLTADWTALRCAVLTEQLSAGRSVSMRDAPLVALTGKLSAAYWDVNLALRLDSHWVDRSVHL